jgi:hypothetical protein
VKTAIKKLHKRRAEALAKRMPDDVDDALAVLESGGTPGYGTNSRDELDQTVAESHAANRQPPPLIIGDQELAFDLDRAVV